MSNGNETMEMTLKTVETWQWTPKWRIKMIIQTNKLDWELPMKHMKDWKSQKTSNHDENHRKQALKPAENKKITRMEHRKLTGNEWKVMKDDKWMKWKMEKEKPKHMKVKSMDFWDLLRG